MLKKMAVTSTMLIAATAGAVATCSSVLAAPAILGSAPTQVMSGHNRNWNGTENENFNHIRLRVHNRNNNIAVADDSPGERV